MAVIYKILTADQWRSLQQDGAWSGAPVDRADGFIHFSTAEQVEETARRHFMGQEGLVLAACDAGVLGSALRWEPSRGGALFPHLYGDLGLRDVLWGRPLPLGAGGEHVFPELQP